MASKKTSLPGQIDTLLGHGQVLYAKILYSCKACSVRIIIWPGHSKSDTRKSILNIYIIKLFYNRGSCNMDKNIKKEPSVKPSTSRYPKATQVIKHIQN